MTSLMWFRDDLRLLDNQALDWANERGPVVAVVLDEPATYPARPLGAAAGWWREVSLARLARSLDAHGVPLLRAAGDARELTPPPRGRPGHRRGGLVPPLPQALAGG
ncbi:deoxyribodipyrimidine photo-lyase [Corynebacterium sp. HMSC04H06]|uniref:deoxyribodipyrimidine photo-lyase n=1 Tax=Corynebacterium sp. HMSC04H06 TaxID=1581050 RepID=UPI001FEE6D2C|nr:deoxyribodipyrimidine photo-lyase [Corynebacterium sp. HMSC04H06]